MSLLALVARELLYRKWSAALTALAVAVACTATCFVVLAARAAETQTRIIQRDIGLNVLILPAATNLDRYWTLGYSEHSMPEAYTDRLADQQVANRLIPLLQHRVAIGNTQAMLTGMAPERFIDNKKRPVFSFEIEPSTAIIGDTIAAALNLERGASVDILGERFRVERVLAPQGSAEDARIYTTLADAQRLLDLPGRINEIQALECECDAGISDPLAALRAQLQPLLPDTTIIRRASLADARLKQRAMAQRNAQTLTPVIVILAGLWTATLMLLNVRDRRSEIGILRSLGFASSRIAAVWTTRALCLGLAGAILGWVLGNALFLALAERLFTITQPAFTPDPQLLLGLLLAGPAFAALAGLVPIAIATRTDPASLMETT
jgi:putative ABC transport system permease protein